MNYEIIGIAGTLLILVAFLCNSQRNIRLFDAVGALLFVIYGALIGSYSTVILNVVLIVIHIVKLLKIERG